MQYLYATNTDGKTRLVATFDREDQLRDYVRWATLKPQASGGDKFEPDSVLGGGYERWDESSTPLTDEDPRDVSHNPSPSIV